MPCAVIYLTLQPCSKPEEPNSRLNLMQAASRSNHSNRLPLQHANIKIPPLKEKNRTSPTSSKAPHANLKHLAMHVQVSPHHRDSRPPHQTAPPNPPTNKTKTLSLPLNSAPRTPHPPPSLTPTPPSSSPPTSRPTPPTPPTPSNPPRLARPSSRPQQYAPPSSPQRRSSL